MRIAIFTEVYWPMVSGVAATLRRVADALGARGHAVRVYTAEYPLPDGTPDRPEARRFPATPIPICPEVRWAFAPHAEVVADLRAFRPDIVHLATEAAMGFAGLRAAQALRLPIIASAHTDYERYAARYGLAWAVAPGWSYLRWFYGQAARVLCPTAVYARFLESRGIPHTGLFTRGVNADEFHPRFRSEPFRAALGAAPGDLLVSCVGRLAPEKNVPILLEAWRRLHASHPRAHLVLVGEGLMAPAIAAAGLPRVRLLGYRHGAALAEAYASSDLFAFPSTTETFGNVLLEAMASGLPSVAADAGGIPEFARHGRNALLAAPDDADAFTAALDRLLSDPALRLRLAHGARETALARRWDAIHDALLAEYAGAAGREGRVAA